MGTNRTQRLIPCPKCDHDQMAVIDTRPVSVPFEHARRRRKCVMCGHRVTTREIICDEDDLWGFVATD